MNRMLMASVAAALTAAASGGAWWYLSTDGAPTAAPAAAPAQTQPEPLPQTPPAPVAAADPAGAAGGEPVIRPIVVSVSPVAAPAIYGAGDFVSVERGFCFGPCPVYKATAYGDERLVFEGRKFVKASGRSERRLDAGGFARLVDVARRYDFAAMASRWPDERGLNCPEPPTDMPTVTIEVSAGEIRHTVSFYEGCRDAAGGDRVVALVAELDRELGLADWIGAREDWYGRRDKP